MELKNIKKRLETFKNSEGKLYNVSDELMIAVLRSWENWSGTHQDYYSEIGVTSKQWSKLLGNAKKAHREGRGGSNGEFTEIAMDVIGGSAPTNLSANYAGIELCWDAGKVIRFSQVEQLLEFLKKAA